MKDEKDKKIKKITKKELKRLEKREINKKDKEWREKVKARDNSQCVICDAIKFVHTHHIIPREVKEFRWNIDNGICLCARHHKFSRDISAHGNPLMFIRWLDINRGKQLNNLMKTYDKIQNQK